MSVDYAAYPRWGITSLVKNFSRRALKDLWSLPLPLLQLLEMRSKLRHIKNSEPIVSTYLRGADVPIWATLSTQFLIYENTCERNFDARFYIPSQYINREGKVCLGRKNIGITMIYDYRFDKEPYLSFVTEVQRVIQLKFRTAGGHTDWYYLVCTDPDDAFGVTSENVQNTLTRELGRLADDRDGADWIARELVVCIPFVRQLIEAALRSYKKQ